MMSKEELEQLVFFASKDDNKWYRLRKVELEVCYKEDGKVVYRKRYFTTFFPKLKYRLVCRSIKRLWKMEGA